MFDICRTLTSLDDQQLIKTETGTIDRTTEPVGY